MIFLLKYWRIAALLLAIAAAWGSGYRIRARMADADLAELAASHATTLADLERTNRIALQTATDAARAAENKRVADMAALDLKYTQEMTNAKRETDAALAAVRSGELRLRNRFTCNSSATSSSVPETGAGSRVDNDSAGGGLQTEDAVVLVQWADRADAIVRQLNACIAIVQADRQ